MNGNFSWKRLAIGVVWSAFCVGAGFMLATGWEVPSQLSAVPTTASPIGGGSSSSEHSFSWVDPEGHSPFVGVVEKVKPTVVSISAEKTLSNHPSIPFDLFDWGPFWGRPPRRQSQDFLPRVRAGGSGIIVDTQGYILTNNHVVADANQIKVKFHDGSIRDAKVIGTDPETDVALIKVDSSIPLSMVAPLGNSDSIRIGDWAIAIGNPFDLDWTVTVGVISARGRSGLNISGGEGPSYQDFIQTDASINFGNSGGPLVNIRGEVVGINTAINAQGQGIGFAIPINLARKVMEQLIAAGEVRRGYLGVVPSELDPVKKEALGLDPNTKGVLVEDIQVGTPADKGGLKGGDVILEVDGKPVDNVTDFRFRIADHLPGSDLRLTILRDGKRKEFTFKLADRKDFLASGQGQKPRLRGDTYWLGIEVAETNSQWGRRYGVEDIKGVVVVSVQPNSPADGVLEPGDVIVEIGEMEITSVEDYRKAREKFQDRTRAIPFWVIRDGRRNFIPIKPE